MIEKINKLNGYSLIELIRENYTDMDDFREKPLVFKRGDSFLITEPVKFGVHPAFIKDMDYMLRRYKFIFAEIKFLSAFNYKDASIIEKTIDQIKLFSTHKNYDKFLKAVERFLIRWGYFAKNISEEIIVRFEKKKEIKNFLSGFSVDEIIHIFFVMICFNYDIPKKKIFQALDLFNPNSEKALFSRASSKKVLPFPKHWDLLTGKSLDSLKSGKKKMSKK